MVREVYGVHLSVEEKGRLKKMIRSGRSSAQAGVPPRQEFRPGSHPGPDPAEDR